MYTRPALWIILAAVLLLNVFRAVTQSLTIDEAFTYNDYVAVDWEQARHHVDPNNHVLNTLLAKVSVGWWGPSEWAIRAPSLTGGAIYMLAAMGLVICLFGSTWTTVVVFCALILNPIMLDYLSAARGYSLALGLQFCALLLMVRLFRKPGGKVMGACLHLAIGVALGLSAAANLTFSIPNLILVAVFLLLPWILRRTVDSEQIGLQAGLIFAAAGLTFGELMFGTFEGASTSTFSVGEPSAARSVYILFIRSFQFPTLPGGKLLPLLLAVVIGPVLIASLCGVIFHYLRRPVDTARDSSSEALLLVPLTLLASAAALVTLHLAVGLPYPYERTGIYFLPLMTLTIAAATTVPWKVLSRSALFLLCAASAQYALELKTGWYEEWRFDAGTKRVMQALDHEMTHAHNARPVASRMGISWVYEASVLYYARVGHLDWLAPVTRADPRSGDFDYYYLSEDDQALVAQRGLTVLYRDPVSKAVLAERK